MALPGNAVPWVLPPGTTTGVILLKFQQKKLATHESMLYVFYEVTSLLWGCYLAHCKTSSVSVLFEFVTVKFWFCEFT